MHVIDDALVDRVPDCGLPSIAGGGQTEPFVVIETDDLVAQHEALHDIRSDRDGFLTPAFSLHPESERARALGDGRVVNVAQARERAARIAASIASLSGLPDPVDDTDRLLRFLYTRVGFELRPVRDCKDAQMYRFPLLDALCEYETDSRSWLSALEKADFIEPMPGVVDRIRHCPSCDSAYMNYVDLCPSCESLEIATENFLHCFACGLVAGEKYSRRATDEGVPSVRAHFVISGSTTIVRFKIWYAAIALRRSPMRRFEHAALVASGVSTPPS